MGKELTGKLSCPVTGLVEAVLSLNSLTIKADDKISICKFSKNVKSKLYHIEHSKTRGQTV